ncbi:MAG: hypothetical protein ACRD5L_05860, partial [Bryobacteraceae bacterium]
MESLANLLAGGVLKNLSLDWRTAAGAGAVVVFAGGTLVYRQFHKPPPAEELERRRRLHINHIGRIVEGQVTQLVDLSVEPERARGLLGVLGKTDGEAANGNRKMV